jgi:hypothetical protein
MQQSRDSSVGIATGWTIEVRFPERPVIFLFFTAPRPFLRPTHRPMQWAPGARSPMVKRPGREAVHSPRSSAEVKNGRVILLIPDKSSWRGA